ncbi:MAG: outer membrane beta-barrel domain-containing protein [Deltaproteobacteria bacterium]|nr:outer membrane beta-barrel domain-containing protein [Deltaproteobacteria bacterium]
MRHARPGYRCIALVALCAAALPARAQYDDEDGGGTAVVIQDRQFSMAHEFTLATGTFPLDAFKKGVAFTGRYTLHFDEFNAWEIVGGAYSLNVDSGLADVLRGKFDAQAEALPTLLVVADTNYVMKPLYGKFTLFNSLILYQEMLFAGGLTVTYWSDGSFRPGPDVGAAIRFFVWDWLSVRFDLRHAVVMNGVPFLDPNAQIDNVLYLGAGVSFNVGGGA